MRKTIKISFILIALSLMLFAGCSTTSNAITQQNLGIQMPEPEPLGPDETQADFEDTVKGKVWYSKLQGDENLDNLYQIKIQFNTTSKKITKETYKWERYGRTNKYKYAGYTVQKANYFFGLAGNTIEYELYEDYNVNANSSRLNNTLDKSRKSVAYIVESPERIIWNGELYYVKQAMEKNFIGNYTNQRDFELN